MEENINPMAGATVVSQPKSQSSNEQPSVDKLILTDNSISLSVEMRDGIAAKIHEIQSKTNKKRVFAIIVKGDEFDAKELYIAYFCRPGMAQFSQWMNFVQKDPVQANQMLAQNCFISGDKELIDDDDLFLFGTMNKLTTLVESRNADLVKLSSVTR